MVQDLVQKVQTVPAQSQVTYVQGEMPIPFLCHRKEKRVTHADHRPICDVCVVGSLFDPTAFSTGSAGGVEPSDSVDVNVWKAHTFRASIADVASHKVKLGGAILTAVQKPDGVVMLAEEQTIVAHPSYGPSAAATHAPPFTFAISFNQTLNASWLYPGNRLIAIGKTAGVKLVKGEGVFANKPHVVAQCLHIWKTEGREIANFPYESGSGYYPLEERTFCLEKD